MPVCPAAIAITINQQLPLSK